MTEYLQVWRARVADDHVDRLLAVRPAAIAEAQRLCPELLRADLVNLGDGRWLDVLTWSCADGEERLMARAEEFDAVRAMHELLEDAEAVGRGEIALASRCVEGAEVLECSREAFRQRVSRARRTLRYVIDNRCGLVDPANPCRCGRQIAASEQAGILRRDHLPLAEHPREAVRVWIEPVAKQLDDVVAIGDLYRFDRFAAPAALWDDLQQRYPALLAAG